MNIMLSRNKFYQLIEGRCFLSCLTLWGIIMQEFNNFSKRMIVNTLVNR